MRGHRKSSMFTKDMPTHPIFKLLMDFLTELTNTLIKA